ncbi:MAG TPA: helix-turn-helix domain-containing protein [Gemmataceae bacterium]|nr:helix-turn-helix domain-containing protein [Gemmataceae bacterium]
MGRHKTISDDEVLRVAREVFRERGHTATTREVAEAAGISEAVLYQRFGSKNDLFFAAMHPIGPDIDRLFGPEDPPDDAHAYLHETVVRLGEHFADIIPVALHLMTHPSFDPASLSRVQPGGPQALRDALAKRLASLAQRRRVVTYSEAATARLLLSIAHDWALGGVLRHAAASGRVRDLKEMVDVVWEGLRPRRG